MIIPDQWVTTERKTTRVKNCEFSGLGIAQNFGLKHPGQQQLTDFFIEKIKEKYPEARVVAVARPWDRDSWYCMVENESWEETAPFSILEVIEIL